MHDVKLLASTACGKLKYNCILFFLSMELTLKLSYFRITEKKKKRNE